MSILGFKERKEILEYQETVLKMKQDLFSYHRLNNQLVKQLAAMCGTVDRLVNEFEAKKIGTHRCIYGIREAAEAIKQAFSEKKEEKTNANKEEKAAKDYKKKT